MFTILGKTQKIIWYVVIACLALHLISVAAHLCSPQPIPVLLFHSIGKPHYRSDIWGIPKEQFIEILEFLKNRHIRTLSLSEMNSFLKTGIAPKNPPYVLLTFDDACKSHLTIVAPELKKRSQTGVFFVPFPWEETALPGKTPTAFLQTKAELTQLLAAGEVQSHARTFETLPKKPQESDIIHAQRLDRNVRSYKEDLSTATGKRVFAIAYPSGEYTDKIIQYVKDSGYEMAFTTEFDTVNSSTSPYEIPRFMLTSNNAMDDIKKFVTPGDTDGIWLILLETVVIGLIVVKLRKETYQPVAA